MPSKTYVTSMPDKTGAFLLASRIIAKHQGNIVRVSYNKAVDLHTLFIDVEADEGSLAEIARELESVGYLKRGNPEVRVIVVAIKLPDRPGALLPVLKVLDRYDINISYINSSSNHTPYQHFKMGLLIEDPPLIKMLLDEISELYPIDIIDYDDSQEILDNTIFYIRLANEMQKCLGLSAEKTMEFISESNRILQLLQEKGENPAKVFDSIRRFAHFIGAHQGSRFQADIEKLRVSEAVVLYSIQPPCGSNTYVLETSGELTLIDTGYAIYAAEMFAILRQLFPDWERRLKKVYITHADVDHCGLLSKLPEVTIGLNQKSADSLRRQSIGIPDYRETRDAGFGYSRLSRIISGYLPPDAGQFELIDQDTPGEHDELIPIGKVGFADLEFEVWEGSGGHLEGEMVYLCRARGIAFTGDNLVNISGFSPERAEFNSLAPYLMRSVNVDSGKATAMRQAIIRLIEEVGRDNRKPCLICGGHGPLSVYAGGRLTGIQGGEKITL
ncbi:glyoxylase-like metal-dependent hydrolase (beta-lactamase superfamily II) [Hydrogenispora ethanolica]|jgi:glyoxylase-like metal-dependent hydrolase (beta-lactamase superfamily II)/ACT domain-containing protein|uniref:Glyoxylase-like metal-dependent hydrolase (Beta-lactamase superfamily II) n=1 Tax=Hydrogenispora ethanolica TaxID=1082276 RepID=A0A4R1SBV1_HYDET|nr:MBL fold metallo-hydrolase [Hydrogenispora ethanolica]TCL77036.1 glyoxylase-like metal-dependent hydrolase (beta-lactamase superfamily II) [Hydrogenispora ethanolica]